MQWWIFRSRWWASRPSPTLTGAFAVIDTTRECEAMATGTRRFGTIEDTVQFRVTGVVSVQDGAVRFDPGW